jgi:SAM-dependent methyltransferase
MNTQSYWNAIYNSKTPSQMSWFRPHLDRSLALIEWVAGDRSTPIIDIGGGESTLVDDLTAAGYRDITVLDISQTAIDHTRRRLGHASRNVAWLCGDILDADLPKGRFGVWHDRAVFHFLTTRAQRLAYVRQVVSAVARGGHVIVGTFGPEGPKTCSGLEVMRYDSDSLHAEFGDRFRLVESSQELHRTPLGATQQFLYCYCVLL